MKREAQEYHDRLRAEYWRVKHLGDRPPRRTWDEAVIQWLEDKEKKRDYRNDVAKFRWFNKYLRGIYLDAINWDVLNHLAKVKKDEGVADSTVNRYMALIRSVLRRAKGTWSWIDNCPSTPMRDEGDPVVRFLT